MTSDHLNIQTDSGNVSGRDTHISTVYGTQIVQHGAQRILWERPNDVPPHVDKGYISRQADEDKLRTLLVNDQEAPVVFLHGFSGAGKSALASTVVRQLRDAKEQHFTDGFLFGDLDRFETGEILRQFMESTDSAWTTAAPRPGYPFKEVFWKRASQRPGRVLIVLDHVHSVAQLTALLPLRPADYGQCRVLVIGTRYLSSPSSDLCIALPLQGFMPEEADAFFCAALSEEYCKRNIEALRRIGERVGYMPDALKLTTRVLASKATTAAAYLAHLATLPSKATSPQSEPLPDEVRAAVERLSTEQQELFSLLGVLGEGSWHPELLAAMALRQPDEIAHDVVVLANLGMVEQVELDRYRVGSHIRGAAQQRFRELPRYLQHTAYTLIAHYFLGLAYDIDRELHQRARAEQSKHTAKHLVEPAFVRSFRRRLLADMPHIRQVLEWATKQHEWALLRRFAALSYLELLQGLRVSGYDIQLALSLVTIAEPVVWRPKSEPLLRFEAYVGTAEWTVSPELPATPAGTSERYSVVGTPNTSKRQCELNWEIVAGVIIDGCFTDMRLVDTRWLGVRAASLVCADVDLIGCHLIACDFSGSTWRHCDARYAVLQRSSFNHSLLRDVRLQGAELSGASFDHARLEHVWLRGAHLRSATFVGCTFEHVDFRGADLNGANFSGATFGDGCTMAGAQLEHVLWLRTKGLEKVPFDHDEQRVAILKDAQVSFDASEEKRHSHGRATPAPERLDDSVPPLAKKTLGGYDLRALKLQGWQLSGKSLRGVDLRAADLCGVQAHSCTLDRANLRGAWATGAQLQDASLLNADLRAVDLCDAILPNAKLDNAIARSAILTGANLQGASLRGTDLYCADLRGCDLRGADLTGANLYGADLSGAQLEGATLTGAVCTLTHFSGARVLDEQLAQASDLAGVVLPDNTTPQLFRVIHDQVPVPGTALRFSRWEGDVIGQKLERLDLLGAQLVGVFSNVSFVGSSLLYARLSGIFWRTIFSDVDLTGADLSDAVLIECDLSQARGLIPDQLRQAQQLRHSRLTPDGHIYDGRYRLAGDLEEAAQGGVNVNDERELWERFYNGDPFKFNG